MTSMTTGHQEGMRAGAYSIYAPRGLSRDELAQYLGISVAAARAIMAERQRCAEMEAKLASADLEHRAADHIEQLEARVRELEGDLDLAWQYGWEPAAALLKAQPQPGSSEQEV